MLYLTSDMAHQVQALQFEWAWQHPLVSKAVKAAAEKLGTTAMRGAKGKVHHAPLIPAHLHF